MKKIMNQEKSGFTLIELIIVIAVMGILAGVGTVAYTGYVKRANQAVDQQSVADLIYAVQLADYSDPNLFEDGNVGMIFLTDSGTVASIGTTDYNSDSGALTAALNNAVNLEGISLQYSGWGTSTSAAQAILALASEESGDDASLSTLLNGGAVVSYASNASELWDSVESYCSYAVTNMSTYSGYTEGELLASTAGATVSLSGVVSAWNSTSAITSTAVGGSGADEFAAALALRIARNHAFAEYLKGVDNVVASDISKIQSYAWTIVNDVFNEINTGGSLLTTDTSVLSVAMSDYLDSGGCSYTDSSGNTQTCSQAYLDAMAYLTLMKAVDEVSNGEDAIYDPTSSTYMDNIENYVLYGASICSGLINLSAVQTMLESIESSSVIVIITVYKNDDGIQCDVLPTAADVRNVTDSSDGEDDDVTTCVETHTTSIKVNSTKYLMKFIIDEGSATSPGSITLCSIDSTYSSITFENNTVADGYDYTITVTDGLDVVSVSGKTVTALKTGTATLTVTNGTKTSTVSVTVH